MKLFIIYLVSFVLLQHVYDQRQNAYQKVEQGNFSFLTKREQELYENFNDHELASLWMSFLVGHRTGLAPTMKDDFSYLYLNHLFTPSGLHLSSFLLLLVPFSFLLRKKKGKKLQKYGSLLFCSGLFFIDGFYSMKRLALLRLGFFVFSWVGIADTFVVFNSVFMLDFILGTYRKSPLSYTYSFIFLGLLMAFLAGPLRKQTLFLMPLFFAGDILIAYFQHSLVPFLLAPMNFILTSLFTFIYPWLITLFIFKLYAQLEFFLHYYDWLVTSFALIARQAGGFYSSFPLLCFCGGLFLFPRAKFIFLFLLLLHSDPLLNHENKQSFFGSKKKVIVLVPNQNLYEGSTALFVGYNHHFINGVYCKQNLANGSAFLQCDRERRPSRKEAF